MPNNRWQSKVDALIRLAEDQSGKPEGILAAEKLKLILERHPEAAQEYRPLRTYAWRTFTMADLGHMKIHNISIHGSWTGVDLPSAMESMIADYWQRIDDYHHPTLLLGAAMATIINERVQWNKMYQ